MAIGLLRNAAVRINSVELTDHVRSVSVQSKFDEIDATTMGSTGKRTVQGFSDDQFVVDFAQDYAASSVDQTLWPLFQNGSAVLMEVWPSGTTTSSTNPKYSATVIMFDYSPIVGGVGDLNSSSVTFKAQGAIARATA